MAENKNVFDVLFATNVNEHCEKKNTGSANLTYLSWAWAWAYVKQLYPDTTYSVREWDNKPYLFDENLGYLVETSVTIEGQTLSMRLPVMDGTNKAQKHVDYTYSTRNGDKTVVAATMFDINTAIMRCLVKNLGMFGLGLYIYSGEDIPQAEADVLKTILPEALDKLKACKTQEELDEVKKAYPQLSDTKKFKDMASYMESKFSGLDF